MKCPIGFFESLFVFLLKLSSRLALALLLTNQTLAAQTDAVSMQVPPVVTSPACVYSYTDTFANTSPPPNTGGSPTLSPGVKGQTGISPGQFGPSITLKFNNFGGTPTTTSPPVPCDGFYMVSFVLDLEASDAMNCYNGEGENIIGICVATSDQKAAYKDPWGNVSSPGSVYGCNGRTFIQYVQCAYGNNIIKNWWAGGDWNNGKGNQWNNSPPFGGPWGYPVYINHGWFDAAYVRSYSNAASYLDQYWLSVMNYSPFCRGGNYWTNCGGGTFKGYPWVYYAPPQGYCTMQPFNFNTTVFLHAGNTITAPVLSPQSPNHTRYAILPDGQGNYGAADFLPNATCALRVVNGHFSVTFLHN